MATIIGRPGRLSRASAANGKLGLSVWHSDGGGGVVVLPILFCLRRYLPWRAYGLKSVFIYFTFSPPGSVRVDWLILFDLCSLLCFCIVIRFIARTKLANTLIDRQLQSTPLNMNEWYKRQDSRKIIIGANRTQPLCVCETIGPDGKVEYRGKQNAKWDDGCWINIPLISISWERWKPINVGNGMLWMAGAARWAGRKGTANDHFA